MRYLYRLKGKLQIIIFKNVLSKVTGLWTDRSLIPNYIEYVGGRGTKNWCYYWNLWAKLFVIRLPFAWIILLNIHQRWGRKEKSCIRSNVLDIRKEWGRKDKKKKEAWVGSWRRRWRNLNGRDIWQLKSGNPRFDNKYIKTWFKSWRGWQKLVMEVQEKALKSTNGCK